MLKVAAYARVSTDKEDQINSLTNQREYFESYIKSKDDWEFVKVYFDEGITGTQTKKRKGFNRMIDDCKNGKIDLILTKEVSRFARNTVDTLNYTRMLKEYDVGVFSSTIILIHVKMTVSFVWRLWHLLHRKKAEKFQNV